MEGQYFDQYQTFMKVRLNQTGFKDSVLHPVFWQPITDKLPLTLERIYFSPDGVYHQINLNTLVHPKTQKYVLDEKYDIQLLTNLKEMMDKQTEINMTKTASLFGKPKYNMDQQLYAQLIDSLRNRGQKSGVASESEIATELIWEELPSTDLEVIAIDSLLKSKQWQSAVFLGEQALEEQVKKVNNPTILHIATHGHFDKQE
jgi:CHAT domain-containing protein